MRRSQFALVFALALLPALVSAAEVNGSDGGGIPFKKESDVPAGVGVTVVLLGVLALGATYVLNRRGKAAAPSDITVLATKRIGMRTGLVLIRVKDKEILLANTNDRLSVVESWAVETPKETV